MLVRCRCGKRLQVKESSIGKKIRCPACAEVFRAEAGAGDAPDEIEGNEGESSRARARKLKPGASGKTRVSVTRNVVGGAVLGVLLVAAVLLFLKKFSAPGSLQLEITLSTVEVFIDGHKTDFPPQPKMSGLSLTLDLAPGTHTVKVTKDRYHPFTKEIALKSGETEVLKVDLKRIVEEASGPAVKDFEGTWVVTYSNKTLRVYTVTADGKVMWEQVQKPYVLSDWGDDFFVDMKPGRELWKLTGGKLHVTHLRSSGPPGLPGLPVAGKQGAAKEGAADTAVGERKTAQELAEDAKVLSALEGKWKITYSDKTQGGFTADASGRLTDGRKLVRIKGHVLLEHLNGRMDRLMLEGNQLKLEHYNPSSKYLDDPDHPQMSGTAVRE
jgi:hypothetical protein